MTTVIVVILVAALLLAALRLWLTASRLDRLHVRTQAAWAALEGALARRVVAARALAAAGGLPPDRAVELRALADTADAADRPRRGAAENNLSTALDALPAGMSPELTAVLADAAERVVLARRFYNDAVRDTMALRASWFTRFFRLAGHASLPEYFEITEDTAVGPVPERAPAGQSWWSRTAEADPVQRTASRVVLLDSGGRVLLFRAADSAAGGRRWSTPGGGVVNGEDLRGTAVRELADATGLRLTPADLVGPIWRRTADITDVSDVAGVRYQQIEYFFAASAPGDGVGGGGSGAGGSGAGGLNLHGLDATAEPAANGHRWWSPAELARASEPVFPVEMSARLPEAQRALAGDGPSGVPTDIR